MREPSHVRTTCAACLRREITPAQTGRETCSVLTQGTNHGSRVLTRIELEMMVRPNYKNRYGPNQWWKHAETSQR